MAQRSQPRARRAGGRARDPRPGVGHARAAAPRARGADRVRPLDRAHARAQRRPQRRLLAGAGVPARRRAAGARRGARRGVRARRRRAGGVPALRVAARALTLLRAAGRSAAALRRPRRGVRVAGRGRGAHGQHRRAVHGGRAVPLQGPAADGATATRRRGARPRRSSRRSRPRTGSTPRCSSCAPRRRSRCTSEQTGAPRDGARAGRAAERPLVRALRRSPTSSRRARLLDQPVAAR